VAQQSSSAYAVSARGLNGSANSGPNKLLVLIDGRSVYSPLFSGVFWDVQDVLLEDVERIEVISGPGATLWGANAVNGVINVITKAAGATQGTLASVAGDREQRTGAVRYGGVLAGGGRYRIYAKTTTHEDLRLENGVLNPTGWNRSQAGFRADWGQAGDALTVQGDAYTGELHQFGTSDISIAGANLLARKSMRLASGTELSAQAFWDFTEREQPGALTEHLNTLDVQLQSAMTLSQRHRMVAGAGYRIAYDRIANGPVFAFLPGDINLHWGNVFVQNETQLGERLRVIAGLKLEHNNYTGVEWLPTLRMAFKPTASSSLWTALSRTVRAPSRIDRDFYAPTVPAVVNGVPQTIFAGGPDFVSEVAQVAEVGYRMQPASTLSLSATAFYSQYDRLRTIEPNPAGPGQVLANMASGRTRGLELWGEWQATPALRFGAGAVLQRIDTTIDPGSRDVTAATGLATADPERYVKLRASWDIAAGHSLDVIARHYGELPRPHVPAYSAVDLNYIWRLLPSLDLSVAARNLLDAGHAEFGAGPQRGDYRRNIGLRLVWRQ
jgi:iron complex outermembrane receptor protein